MTSIPDNSVVTLTYVDPTTGQNTTCSDPCPLSDDSSIPYQDFTFDVPDVITGFQLTINEWSGKSAGLHLLQLLSNGAFASAIADENRVSCFAPNPSSVQTTGTWTPIQAFTGIAGTTQNVLVSSVNVGATSASVPTLTWRPYVSASGTYDVYIWIPGCQNLQDCGKRTSAKVTVFPGGDLEPWVTTVNQQVNDDTKQLIYSGPVFPTTPEFVSTVTLTLADSPTGKGQGGKYQLVADRVSFELKAVNTTGGSGNGTLNGQGIPGFGFFEWPLASTEAVNATGILPNTSLSTLSDLGFDLYSAIGATDIASSTQGVKAFISQSEDSILFAGLFYFRNMGVWNFAAYSGGNIVRVSEGGLNGVVNALVASDDKKTIWAGGAFSDSAEGNGRDRFRGVVQYDAPTQTWTALGGGVDGEVVDLSVSDGKLFVVGNFTHVLSASGEATAVGGYATWDIASKAWVQAGGYLVGAMTMTISEGRDGKEDDGSGYIAGTVQSWRQYGASGWALLENGDDGRVRVKPAAVQLGRSIIQSTTTTTTATPVRVRRGKRSPVSDYWLPKLKTALSGTGLFKRQTPALTLPAYPSTPAPAVLAGAYWTNTSSSTEVVILGGNFSVPSTSQSSAQGVALYDTKSQSLTALRGSQVNGVVRSVAVSGDKLFVGGEFTLDNVRGFGMYDLAKQEWQIGDIQSLQGTLHPTYLFSVPY